jgi:HEPN domain-containing protein
MDRSDFQNLAAEHIADAKALLAAKRWGGAYYLAGYAVECGLKACVLVRLSAEVGLVFEDRRFSEKCWTHNLEQLLSLAGLMEMLVVDPELFARWDIVKDWNEASRYERRTKNKAEELYGAVTDKKHGVLTWIRARWLAK